MVMLIKPKQLDKVDVIPVCASDVTKKPSLLESSQAG